jgi:transaldolase
MKNNALLATTVVDADDFDPAQVVAESYSLLKVCFPSAEIIAASMRSVLDAKKTGLAGAHIVTLPPKLFPVIVGHYKTDEAVDSFLADIGRWLN